MTIKEFADLFDTPYSMEELFSRQEELLECDFIDDKILNELLSAFQNENKPLIDRRVVTRAISTYIATTGNFSYFIRDLLKELLLKDGCSKESIIQILMQANEQAIRARERNREKRLVEKKKKEDALKKLEESIDMSKTSISYDTARFLIRNGITYEELEKNISVTISSQEDIDPILYQYRISDDGKKEMVSIADVVGYDYRYISSGKDLLKAFPSFFSSHGDTYHTRSISMLDLTTENAMEALRPSFDDEPMKLADAPGGRYTINGNGMHRYSVLRSLYLIEMAKGNDNQSIREKYTISALVSRIDYVKTYSNYILTSLKVVDWLSNERDPETNQITGRAKLEFRDGSKLFLTDQELIAYVAEMLKRYQAYPFVQQLSQRKEETLTRFLSVVVPEMVGNYSLEETDAKVI